MKNNVNLLKCLTQAWLNVFANSQLSLFLECPLLQRGKLTALLLSSNTCHCGTSCNSATRWAADGKRPSGRVDSITDKTRSEQINMGSLVEGEQTWYNEYQTDMTLLLSACVSLCSNLATCCLYCMLKTDVSQLAVRFDLTSPLAMFLPLSECDSGSLSWALVKAYIKKL